MDELALHILDLAENSIAAGATTIEIDVVEDLERDLLAIEIRDNGRGMEPGFAQKALDPFVTTRTDRQVGLGLSLFAEAARMSNGRLTVESGHERGTTVRAVFQHSHVDRKPLGNMADTLITLIVGNPEIDFVYRHTRETETFELDSKEVKAQLRNATFSSPEGVKLLREKLKKDFGEFREGR